MNHNKIRRTLQGGSAARTKLCALTATLLIVLSIVIPFSATWLPGAGGGVIGAAPDPPPRMRVSQDILEPAGGEVAIGQNITFRITVRNVGLLPISYLWVKDQYPLDSLRYLSSEPSGRDDGDGYVTWNGVRLPPTGLQPNDSVSVQITFRVVASYPNMVNYAQASGWTTDNRLVPSAYDEAPISVVSRNLYCVRSWADYAPAGMPDFDQKQGDWKDPTGGGWSYSGPAAAANILWWLDSAFEERADPGSDNGYPLVAAYQPGLDDHDPRNVPYLVEDLAFRMDTDGQRTGDSLRGTRIDRMRGALLSLLQEKGLADQFEVVVERAPTAQQIRESVGRCDGVVLLLGFWERQGAEWRRLGGHYVAVPCVSREGEAASLIEFSDPYWDRAEENGAGRYNPGLPHGHTGDTPWAVHNDATYLSWDLYNAVPMSLPVGVWGPQGYLASAADVQRMVGQNPAAEHGGGAPSAYRGGEVLTSVERTLRIRYLGEPSLCPRPPIMPGPTPTLTPEYGPPQTVALQRGLSGYDGVRDTFLNSWSPGENFGRDGVLQVRSDGHMRSLVAFDLTAIPAGSRVIDARLDLHIMAGGWYEQDVSAYPVLASWTVGEATWRRASFGTAWSAPGCGAAGVDRAEAPVGTELVVTGTTIQFDLTGLVQSWVARPSSNRGLLLQGAHDIAVQHSFASSEHWYVSRRPKLTITYSVRK